MDGVTMLVVLKGTLNWPSNCNYLASLLLVSRILKLPINQMLRYVILLTSISITG